MERSTLDFPLSKASPEPPLIISYPAGIRWDLQKTLFQFVKRLDPRILNKKSLESLAYVGALDRFGDHRAQIVEALDLAIHYAEHARA